ncbi:DNA internalization-related competence protein ComEC/Rec2 [Deefgea salmonis]|uniref:DNA internalization-related competence protein ComEC/Rec2 n=1 Tax=Deefgea salmonis TaxID=2875502 RepID=A0ABS8BJP4_9NEIS|nr:DNA internalization-related competence protein ComEC/Rec2 [Deefgea salmonis]MCB5195824.1 DNA internalization-related competence protein ComEC/Rec2 [Deefgea salmonis]
MLSRYLLFIFGWVLGIIALQQQAALPALGWVLTIALLALGLLFYLNRRQPKSVLQWLVLLVLAFSLGFAWANWRAQMRMAQRIPADLVGQTLWMSGFIADLPQDSRYGPRFIFTPDADPKRAWQVDKIQVNAKGGPFGAGERWRLQLKLKPIHGVVNSAGVDLEAWFLQQNIAAIASMKSAERLPGFSVRAAVLRVRAALRERIEHALQDAPYQGVIVALTIGDQAGIPKPQWQRFALTGITHLISISGLHITMLAAMGMALVRYGWRRSAYLTQRLAAQRAALIAGVLIALIYSVLAGMSVPTQRTVLMLLVGAVCMWRARPMAISAIWATALAVVVLFDPFAVLSVGFWLSFLAVAYLLWVGANRIGHEPAWRLWLSTQWAATLASLPILVLVFGQVPLMSPLANALAIPLVSVLITPLALLGLLDPTGTLLRWAEGLFSILDRLLQWLLTWPWPALEISSPPMGILPMAMLGVALLLLPRGIPARWLGWVMLLPLFFMPQPKLDDGQFKLQVLDVDQGLSVLVQTRQHALLFDTGREANAERVILPVLRQAGITQLDTLLLSHNDNDHIGGAPILLGQGDAAALPIHLILHSLPENQPILSSQVAQQRCQTGQRWHWDGVDFEVLWLRADYAANNDNARGCVLRIHNRWHSALIPADISRVEEGELLAAALPATDIVIAPHHGSKSASSDAFIQALQPQYTVFSAGFMNQFRHPHPEVLARYAAAGASILRTDQDGSLQFTVGELINLQRQRAIAPRYWYTAIYSDPQSAAGNLP